MSGRKKRRPQRSRRHPRARRAPYEDWPAFKPVPGTDGRLMELDPNELTPEQRAEWDRGEAERERSRKLHERFAKRMAYRFAVRDGLIKPPWMKPTAKEPKAGSAAAWINELCPNGEWRVMTGKQIHQAIEREARSRKLNKWPSLRAVQNEIATRTKQT